MAYQFSKKPTATFQFLDSSLTITDKTKLAGINATLGSAAVICDGVASLMAIGGNEPYFNDAVRTAEETVYDDQQGE